MSWMICVPDFGRAKLVKRGKFTGKAGLIYEDIWCLAAGFRSISASCVRRSANGVAHALAKFARLSDNDIVWMEEDPPPAVDALYLDFSILI